MSRTRLLNRTSTSRFTIALGAPALAVAAIAAGGGLVGSATAQPLRPAHPAVSVQSASSPDARPAASSSARLLTTQASAVAASSRRLGRNQRIAWRMMSHRFGWRPRYQFRALNRLWSRESSWNVRAYNPYSGAYGIPQAVPGSKMGSAGSNWRTSARTQIRWGLRYIRSRYGKPRHAWAHECAYGWY